MNIKKLISQLFKTSNSGNYNVPVHSELLKRSTKEKFNYAEWVQTGQDLSYLKLLQDNYRLRQKDVRGTIDFQLFQSGPSNGFYFGNHSVFKGDTFSFLFDKLKDRAEEMGYLLKNNHRQYRDVGEKVKCTDTYYLKPPLSYDEDVQNIDQMYGNVHLEMVSFDERPEYVKCMVNIYSDRQYKKAKPFDEFMKRLLTETPE